MEDNFLHKVYTIINDFIHHNETGKTDPQKLKNIQKKICPVTRLDISMQPQNSKFISSTGVTWYYEHQYRIFEERLLPFLTDHWKNKPVEKQFKEIAHNVRNTISNPRNNAKRAIKKILDDKNCLFNNLDLIDKRKLKEVGML